MLTAVENGDGIVNAGDLSAIRSALTSPLNTSLPADGSNNRLDIDGSNGLNSGDLSRTRSVLMSVLGTTLASLPPVTAPFQGMALSPAAFASLAGGNAEPPLPHRRPADPWLWHALVEESSDSNQGRRTRPDRDDGQPRSAVPYGSGA